jgi:hypothetical protein
VAISGRLPAAQRVWFDDPRTADRRMCVSSHPEQRIAVVSLWQDRTCSGTFRLPIADAARLISVLADTMAAGLGQPAAASAGPKPGRGAAITAWIRRRFPWPPAGGGGPHLRLLK